MLSKNEFYTKCCRVCGNNDGFYINLLENSENDYMIKIQNLLPIKIEADDNLPKNLCHLCIAKLNDFHELRENCIKMQAALSAIASTWNKNEEREISYDGASAGILHKFNENEPPCRTIRDKNEALRLEKQLTKQNDKRMEETNFDKELNSCSKGSQQHNRSKNDESIRNKDTAASTELEGWTIQRLPNTTLYICNKCSEILVYESATKSHRCRTSSHVMHILPINDPVNQNEKDSGKSDVTSEDENTCRKKRKRIYFGGDD